MTRTEFKNKAKFRLFLTDKKSRIPLSVKYSLVQTLFVFPTLRMRPTLLSENLLQTFWHSERQHRKDIRVYFFGAVCMFSFFHLTACNAPANFFAWHVKTVSQDWHVFQDNDCVQSQDLKRQCHEDYLTGCFGPNYLARIVWGRNRWRYLKC